jgi:hypothetical protein
MLEIFIIKLLNNLIVLFYIFLLYYTDIRCIAVLCVIVNNNKTKAFEFQTNQILKYSIRRSK